MPARESRTGSQSGAISADAWSEPLWPDAASNRLYRDLVEVKRDVLRFPRKTENGKSVVDSP